MDKWEDSRITFEKQWGDKFATPPPAYENMHTEDDIEQKIHNVKQRIQDLSLQLKKEEFQLTFLEVIELFSFKRLGLSAIILFYLGSTSCAA